jgi:hypothetical protein
MKHKKSVLFTLISLLVAVLFVTTFSTNAPVVDVERTPATNMRITIIDTYVKSFERYAEDSLDIATYRTLDALYNYSATRRTFFSDRNTFQGAFSQCLICGKINCTVALPVSCGGPIEGNDLDIMLKNISSIALANLNIFTNYSINSVNISQSSAFAVDVVMNLSFNVSDVSKDNYASWRKNIVVKQSVPITGLKDPATGINSGKTYIKTIKRTTICEYNLSCWNTNTALQFYISQEFRNVINGTSYLERFWNSTNSSCPNCKIESFLNTSIAVNNNSYVDTAYWTGKYGCGPGFTIPLYKINYPSTFILDEATAIFYGINITNSAEATKICP